MKLIIGYFIVFFGMTSFGQINAQTLQSEQLIDALNSNYNLNFCGENVPLDDPDVRERFEKQFLLALQDRAQVLLWIKRSGRYLKHIERALRKHRVPDDLKYIAIIESALRPHATSSKNAVGFWQFTEASGKQYGLRIDSEMDERRNIFASTEAAVRYFQALFQTYRSWTLCAAAFNMGENGLETQILMQHVRDFYKLYLPLETQQYVLKAVCAKLILTNLRHFGFDLSKIDVYPELQFDRVNVDLPERAPLSVIAEAAGTYFKHIKDLNPEIRGYYLASGKHAILIPENGARGFNRRLEHLLKNVRPDEKLIYLVQPGDNLTVIAERFNVSVGALLIWNNLSSNTTIHPGDKIIIHQGR